MPFNSQHMSPAAHAPAAATERVITSAASVPATIFAAAAAETEAVNDFAAIAIIDAKRVKMNSVYARLRAMLSSEPISSIERKSSYSMRRNPSSWISTSCTNSSHASWAVRPINYDVISSNASNSFL